MIQQIENKAAGETGLSSRAKLNAVIDFVNELGLRYKIDTASNFSTDNDTYAAGWILIESDDLETKPKFKISSGTTAYNDLPYFSVNTLAQILLYGNKTAEQNIESDNGHSKVKVLNAESTIEFDNGTNSGKFKQESAKASINHNVKVDVNAPLLTLKNTSNGLIANESNASGSYTGGKFRIVLAPDGSGWDIGFSELFNAMSFLTKDSPAGNFMFGSGSETSPLLRFYYKYVYGGFAIQVPWDEIDAALHIRMLAAGNPTDKVFLAQKFDGTKVLAAYNDGSVKKNDIEIATINDVNNAIIGLLDDRGNYNTSSNLYPSTGGSGTSGAVMKGDLWTISTGGTLGGVAVTTGDVVRALVDSPGQTSSNWTITENNLGYVPENSANKGTTMTGNTTSNIVYLTAKAIFDWAVALFAPISSPIFTGIATTPAIIVSSETASTIASFDATKNIKSLSTTIYPSLTELSYGKGVKSAIQAQIDAKQFLVRLGVVAQNNFTSGNFTKVGTFTVAYNSNSIDFSAASSVDFEHYISYNVYQSGSNNFEIVTRHIFSTFNTTSYGIWTGFTANSGASGNKIRMYCSTTNDAASGITTLARYNGVGSITATGSATGFSMILGDVIEQRLIRDINPSTLQYRITAISKNMRTGTTSQVQIDVSYAYPVTIELNNTFKVCFGQIGGTNKLIDWQLRSNDREHVDYLFMGDSKTIGLYTTDSSYRFGNLLATQNSKTLEMYGGPSGRADTMLLCSADFIKYKADKVFLWLGCNQVRGNNALNAACITDLQSIKTALENAGSQVYMIGPAPENGYDFSTFRTAFAAAFPNYIDFWSQFLGTGTSLNATYTDDGVHLNDAGNVLAKNIINSYL